MARSDIYRRLTSLVLASSLLTLGSGFALHLHLMSAAGHVHVAPAAGGGSGHGCAETSTAGDGGEDPSGGHKPAPGHDHRACEVCTLIQGGRIGLPVALGGNVVHVMIERSSQVAADEIFVEATFLTGRASRAPPISS